MTMRHDSNDAKDSSAEPRTEEERLRQQVEALSERVQQLEQEKRHYQWLAESTTDLISRHDHNGVFLYASQAARTLLGYDPDDLIGVSAYDLFHPDDLAALLSKSPRIYYHEGFYEQTYRFRTRSGHYIWFETTSRTRRDPDTGELTDVLCVSRDVSRRVESEARRERLARVVESTTDFVLFCDQDEHVVYCNQAARTLFRLDEEGASTTIAELLVPTSAQRWREQVLPAVTLEGRWSGELALASPSGEIPVLSVVQLHREQGGQTRLSILNRDLSLRLEAEAQARRHQEQITHANRLASLGELATNIAHECNQPLAAMGNYASGALMQLERDPDQPAHQLALPLNRINDQIQRLSERFKHIRRFVRRGSLHLAPQDLAEIIGQACDLCEPQCRHEGVHLASRLAPGLDLVMADAIGLEQVLVNLIRNALDACRDIATPPRPPCIRLEAYPLGSRECCVDIVDDGPGVAPEQRQGLFTPFVSGRKDGLGMGLSISLSLIEAMGGNLVLIDDGDPPSADALPPGPGARRSEDPDAPQGARFRITLPSA